MAAYFEGVFTEESGIELPAQVTLEPSALRISYKTQQDTLPVVLFWQINRIQIEESTNNKTTTLRYGDRREQALQIFSPAFPAEMAAYYNSPVSTNPSLPVTKNRGLGVVWLILIALVGAVVTGYFWLVPAVASFTAKWVPPAFEEKLGDALYKQLVPLAEVDTTKTKLLKGFTRQLKFKADYPIRITVVKKEEPNAFALPGGNIVVHQGILPILKSPEELAALLAHEYGHVKLRHSTRALFRTLSGYIFISALFGDLSGVAAVAVENAHALKSLQYSRALEQEADELGFSVLQGQKLNPYGMIKLFEHLKAQNPDEANEFLSTHPLLDSRIKEVQALVKKNPYPVSPHDSLTYFWKLLQP